MAVTSANVKDILPNIVRTRTLVCEMTSDRNGQNSSNRRALVTMSLSAASALEGNFDDCWYQDCGATQHMSSRKEWFKNYVALNCPSKVFIGNATELKGIGVGDV